MRRGLKHPPPKLGPICHLASNRSPMRRGLKRISTDAMRSAQSRFKPIPDEEGTETSCCVSANAHLRAACFKPIPDEEGTETQFKLPRFLLAVFELQTDPR